MLAARQAPKRQAFCYDAAEQDPNWDIYSDYNPEADADDWCKRAHHQPLWMRDQMNKLLRTQRIVYNPTRYYFDPKREGRNDAVYLDLLLPIMREENRQGVADWRVIRTNTDDEYERVPTWVEREYDIFLVHDNLSREQNSQGNAFTHAMFP